ncbi:MAG: AlpA family transcriptional regulator [Rheinheimera sp.]|uniref:AlpA family transcriptional regulator n=1 Tax=Arsukibacterium sp. UBA3155 TaxID=1946058 RepID=UPI000C8AB05F|nr:AlpA family transcriptional regulator [Arsukibacterium sp. UBA3155]MAD75686.1 AlpA family transcriptional regulator [Rheinheimera sp.]|tara:strand:- start:132633 stop:132818 length:186 start_codon:yes stop_codon:yes gene_type:complete
MKLIKLKAVMECTGLARSTVYKFIAEDRFPKPVKLGTRMVAWVEGEIQEWIREKIDSRSSH